MPEQRRRRWVTPLLVACLVAIFVLCFALAPRSGGEGEAFGGTDSAATSVLEEHGTKPWFEPLFQPGSAEVESGLFALQAALGAGVLGYVLGNLRGRSAARAAAAKDRRSGDAGPDESGIQARNSATADESSLPREP